VSATRTEGRGHRARGSRLAAAAACAAALLGGGAARAQEPTETPAALAWLGLDRLRLTGVGATFGAVKPINVVSTETVGVHADYGEVRPQVRMVFGVTYWGSRFSEHAVRRLADSVRAVVTDDEGVPVELGRVRMTVIALTADARWSPQRRPQWLRPYVGGSVGGYAVNVEGRAISGTFLEDALDGISAGVAAVGGADVFVLPNLSLGLHARYEFLSSTRYGTLRTGLTYIFRAREGT
jgi:hypothetical protein